MEVLFINLFPIDSRRFLVSLGSLFFFSILLVFHKNAEFRVVVFVLASIVDLNQILQRHL